MQKILIVLPDLSGGGAERLHTLLAKHWHGHAKEVRFAVMQKRGELLEVLPPGVLVDDLGVDRIRRAVLPLAGVLRKWRPNVVLSAMWPLTTATVVAWLLAGRPGRLFLSDHNHLSTSCLHELNTSPNTVGRVMRWSYPLADGLIAVSQGVKDDLCQLSGLPPGRIRVIYNPAATGVRHERAGQPERERLWGAGYDHHLLTVGKLKTQKDHVTLIRAFALLPSSLNAKLTILGDGPLRPELTRLLEQSGLADRVSMPGFALDPYPWFLTADLFVLSSKWEGFGNVLVEALECGTPVVSTDCQSGPSEILDGGRYGDLVPPGNPAALAAAIATALRTPHDREALVARSRIFSVDRIAEQYLAYFGEARA